MKSNKQLYIFLAKCIGLYLLWTVLYYGWIQQETDLELWVTSRTTKATVYIMNHFSHEGTFTQRDSFNKGKHSSLIFLNDRPLLYVADSCNAFTLIVLFAGFIIAYPGSWLLKIPFIAVGSVVVFIINVLRCQVLIFNYLYYRTWFDFNHKYTFTIAVYLCVFYFWMLWANRFSKVQLARKNKSVTTAA